MPHFVPASTKEALIISRENAAMTLANLAKTTGNLNFLMATHATTPIGRIDCVLESLRDAKSCLARLQGNLIALHKFLSGEQRHALLSKVEDMIGSADGSRTGRVVALAEHIEQLDLQMCDTPTAELLEQLAAFEEGDAQSADESVYFQMEVLIMEAAKIRMALSSLSLPREVAIH